MHTSGYAASMVKQPVHVASAMLALALASFGCDPPEVSDENQYLVNPGLMKPLGSHSHHVLVGSTFRFEVVSVVEGEVDGDGGGLLCASRSGSGVVVELEEGEFVVEGMGNGTVELADPGISCPANTDILAELGPDRWSVIGVDPADVVGRWAYYWPDSKILDYSMSPGPRGVFPDILGRPLDELRVVADEPFFAWPALVLPNSSEEIAVRWGYDDQYELNLPAHYDHLRPPVDDGWQLEGTLRTGESFESSVTILGRPFPLPPVRAVPVESIASLELVPVYYPGDPQREWGPPIGVVAITRDSEGRRIVGAPVEFELTQGRLAIGADRDSLSLADTCRRAPESPTARVATVFASLGQLEASVNLEWIALPSEDEFDPPPECVDACACTTPSEPTPGLLAMLGLGLWLRVRRRS
jgi:MYXO-CTERM domain-containing protein